MADPYDLDEANARFDAAGEGDDEFVESIKAAVDAGTNKNWFSRMPKNIGVGAYKAALSTLETEADLFEALADSQKLTSAVSAATGVPAPILGFAAEKINQFAPGFLESARGLADEWTRNNTLGDDITQGVAQFAVPFAAYMRAMGGIQLGKTALNVGRAAVAESGAAGTAFDPHEGRVADLVQLGRDSESRFGELLRKISPDGSLTNSYINMMTDRENEGEWEGRFKNVIDSLAGSAVVAGVLKGAATGFRAVRKIAAEPMKVGPAAQRGAVGDLDDITRARALKNTQVEEGGEHIVLEGDTLNTSAEVLPLRRSPAEANAAEIARAQQRIEALERRIPSVLGHYPKQSLREEVGRLKARIRSLDGSEELDSLKRYLAVERRDAEDAIASSKELLTDGTPEELAAAEIRYAARRAKVEKLQAEHDAFATLLGKK